MPRNIDDLTEDFATVGDINNTEHQDPKYHITTQGAVVAENSENARILTATTGDEVLADTVGYHDLSAQSETPSA